MFCFFYEWFVLLVVFLIINAKITVSDTCLQLKFPAKLKHYIHNAREILLFFAYLIIFS